MNCLAVRDRLAEHSLGALPPAEAEAVDRHLEWCAACRKEAGELQRAAATLAFSVAPVEPPAELEEAVVAKVTDAARGRREAPRRRRGALVAVLAAMLAISGLGWGAVMAGRTDRLEQQVRDAENQMCRSIERFQDVIRGLEGSDPANVVELASLLSPRHRPGSGDALVLLSPSSDDLLLVVLAGLTEVRARQLPLEVWLIGESTADVIAGRIRTLDTGGGGGVSQNFVDSLEAFDAVVVRDARGNVLLHGTLNTREPAPLPAGAIPARCGSV